MRLVFVDVNPVRAKLRAARRGKPRGHHRYLGPFATLRLTYSSLWTFDTGQPQQIAQYRHGESPDGRSDGWRIVLPGVKDSGLYSDVYVDE